MGQKETHREKISEIVRKREEGKREGRVAAYGRNWISRCTFLREKRFLLSTLLLAPSFCVLSARPKKEAEKERVHVPSLARSLARRPSAHPPAPRTRAVMPGNPISCISARKRLGGPMQINLARSQRPSSSRLSGRPLERARAPARSSFFVARRCLLAALVASRILLTLSSSTGRKSAAGILISLVTLRPLPPRGTTRFRDINKRILPRDGAATARDNFFS